MGGGNYTQALYLLQKLNENVSTQISRATNPPKVMCSLCVRMRVLLDGAATSPVLDFAPVRNKRATLLTSWVYATYYYTNLTDRNFRIRENMGGYQQKEKFPRRMSFHKMVVPQNI